MVNLSNFLPPSSSIGCRSFLQRSNAQAFQHQQSIISTAGKFKYYYHIDAYKCKPGGDLRKVFSKHQSRDPRSPPGKYTYELFESLTKVSLDEHPNFVLYDENLNESNPPLVKVTEFHPFADPQTKFYKHLKRKSKKTTNSFQ